MKPFKSFLFLVVILSFLLVLPKFFPSGKILIAKMEVRIYNLNFLEIKNPEPINVNEVFIVAREQNKGRIAEVKSGIPENIKNPAPVIKPISQPENELNQKPEMVNSDIFVPTNSENKWAELSAKILNAEFSERPLRILYYGDSQIENDRITSIFRQVLQSRYGGVGRGLVPVENIYNTANNFIMTTSDNWESESVIKSKQKQLDLGLLCESFKINHTGFNQDSVTTSWVKIKSIKNDLQNGYSVLSIFYMTKGLSNVRVTINGNKSFEQELKPENGINELRFNLKTTPDLVEINFSTASEITVYGLNLESPGGIMVDNIALRGLSYPGFSRIDTTRLKQMAQLLNPSFIIMQYGVNVVPNITSNYSYYKTRLNDELASLSHILPNVQVMLVSVSDMAYRTGGTLESYPNIENILNTQKEVAIENGCAFWNLYESMGGKGSMINWVEKTPPLGNKDYVHYTSLGAEKVGNLFARQFIKALELEQATATVANEP